MSPREAAADPTLEISLAPTKIPYDAYTQSIWTFPIHSPTQLLTHLNRALPSSKHISKTTLPLTSADDPTAKISYALLYMGYAVIGPAFREREVSQDKRKVAEMKEGSDERLRVKMGVLGVGIDGVGKSASEEVGTVVVAMVVEESLWGVVREGVRNGWLGGERVIGRGEEGLHREIWEKVMEKVEV